MQTQTPVSSAYRGRRLARPKVAAPYLGVGISTLWDWAAKREGFPQPIKVGPRTTVFDLDALDAYVARVTA